MSMSRQQRRAMARQLAKQGDVQESIKQLDARAHKVADETVAKLKDEVAARAKAETAEEMQGQMMVLFMAWAHINKGYGKKRLADMAWDFYAFCNDMAIESTTVDDLFNMIEQETGLDVRKLFATITDNERARIKERKKAIGGAAS